MGTNIRYDLKSTKGKKKLIYLIFNYGYKNYCPIKKRFKYQPVKISTGVSIEKMLWNRDRIKAAHPYHIELNADLEKIKIITNEVYLQFKLNGNTRPTPGEMKNKIEVKLNRKKDQAPDEGWRHNLILLIEKYIHDQRSLYHKIGPSTIKQYVVFCKKLTALNKVLKTNWNFSEIDEILYANFFLVIKKDFSQNTIHKFRKYFHKFFKLAQRAGIKNDFILAEMYKNDDFMEPEEITPQVFLDFNQIKLLLELNLSDNPRLDRVRDGIICQSFTGLRFSDFKQLAKVETESSISQENFEYISINQTVKTGDMAVIPLFEPMKKIYKKYHGCFPNEISNQKYNDYIKELCEDLFTEEFNFWKTINGKIVNNIRPMYTGISSHTFRRSFATNFYNLGVPVKTLMTILTMKKEETFYRYIRNTKKQNAKQMYDLVSKNVSFTQLFSNDASYHSVPIPSGLS
jgi:site-specific recombinase XerD